MKKMVKHTGSSPWHKFSNILCDRLNFSLSGKLGQSADRTQSSPKQTGPLMVDDCRETYLCQSTNLRSQTDQNMCLVAASRQAAMHVANMSQQSLKKYSRQCKGELCRSRIVDAVLLTSDSRRSRA